MMARWMVCLVAVVACAANAVEETDEQDDDVLLSSLWKDFARTLDPGTPIRVVLKDGRKLTGALLAAHETAIVLRPAGRLAEPERTIEFDMLHSIRREGGVRPPRAAAPGERVRLRTLGSGTLTGTVATIDSERLSLLADGGPGVVHVERKQFRSLEISGGNRTAGRRMWNGAKRGFLVGVAGGIVIGLTHGDQCWFEEGRCVNSLSGNLFMGLTFGAAACNLITLPAGVLIGAASPSERWERAGWSRVALSITPQKHGGAAVAIRVGF